MKHKNITLNERRQHTRFHTPPFHLYEILDKAKL